MTTRHNFDYFAALHSVLPLPLLLLPLQGDLAGRSLLAAAGAVPAAAGHVCEQAASTRGPLK